MGGWGLRSESRTTGIRNTHSGPIRTLALPFHRVALPPVHLAYVLVDGWSSICTGLGCVPFLPPSAPIGHIGRRARHLHPYPASGRRGNPRPAADRSARRGAYLPGDCRAGVTGGGGCECRGVEEDSESRWGSRGRGCVAAVLRASSSGRSCGAFPKRTYSISLPMLLICTPASLHISLTRSSDRPGRPGYPLEPGQQEQPCHGNQARRRRRLPQADQVQEAGVPPLPPVDGGMLHSYRSRCAPTNATHSSTKSTARLRLGHGMMGRRGGRSISREAWR